MEILSPAGNLEKLKYAIYYGANAIYASGKYFGLRAKSINFSNDELIKAVEFCHQNRAKLYITVNIFAHNSNIAQLSSYLKFLNEICVDALIISDPGVFQLAKKFAPNIPIHISTQANVTSWKSVEFWQNQGAKRIILARELTVAEIKKIREKVPNIELEIFVHGAMCMAYSGRCLLSSFLNGRDANRGNCTQPCRWEYQLLERTRPDASFPIEEDKYGTYILNSKDLCLIDQLPKIIEAGIDSIKIEGRMKSLYYVANVTRAYKKALSLLKNQNLGKINSIKNELNKISHRHYTEGFFHSFSSENTQHYGSSAYIRDYQFIGEIIKSDNQFAYISVRAKFEIGEEIEIIFPKIEEDLNIKIESILDENDEKIPFSKPNTIIKIQIGKKISKFGIVRKKK